MLTLKVDWQWVLMDTRENSQHPTLIANIRPHTFMTVMYSPMYDIYSSAIYYKRVLIGSREEKCYEEIMLQASLCAGELHHPLFEQHAEEAIMRKNMKSNN